MKYHLCRAVILSLGSKILALASFAAVAVTAPALAEAQSATVPTAIQSKLLSATVTRPEDRAALSAFYASRDYRPVWVDDRGPTRAAGLAIAELAKAGDWGLDANDFQLGAVAAAKTNGVWTPEQTADAEYEISAAILNYARQARGGRIEFPEQMLSSYLDRRPDLPDPTDVLARITTDANPDSILRSFQPQHEQFQKLQALLAKLRGEGATDPATAIASEGPILLPGRKSAEIANLRRRFAVSSSADGSALYDEPLVDAVKNFQRTSGLRADGIIGAKTRTALSGRENAKLKAVLANMEEWRWMPADLGATHLFVNVPAFSIDLVENGQTVVEERVIVGKESTQTPIFSKELTSVVLKPLWNLPDSIKLEKLLAAQRRGAPIENEGYRIKKGNRIVDSRSIDWNTANLSAYTVFQPSGDGNALGDVKFLFPNKHSVYLHDTPSKALFAQPDRMFSHGCIRLRNPLALAQRLLDDDKGSGRFNVKNLIRRGPGSNQITLDNPLPIHVGYFTVWVGNDGEARFLGDPYGHEKRITLALQQNWKQIDKGVDHLAAVDAGQLKRVGLQGLPKRPQSFDSPPMGVTQIFGAPPKYSKYRERDSVGELMRAALQR